MIEEINMRVKICGVEFKNPVLAASGTYGFGDEMQAFYPNSEAGGVMVKGLTMERREGNPPPRIAETPMGVLNSVGLQNPGLDAFIKDILPRLLKRDTVVIANISANTAEEYGVMAERLSQTGVHMVELNVSCPNIHAGGATFGATAQGVRAAVEAAREKCAKPLIVKLTPNTADITETAKAAEQAGADAISLINTITGMAVDIHARKPVLGNVTGGLSGPAVMPVALRMVYQAAGAVRLPVIGMGGIRSGEDAVAFLLCGARAVAVGTQNMVDPYAIPNVAAGIRRYLEKNGYKDVNEIIGKLEV